MTKDELNLSKSVANSIRAEQIEELKEREKTIEEFAKGESDLNYLYPISSLVEYCIRDAQSQKHDRANV